jgi:membrane-bound lytic murein transglycosylase B
MCFDFHFIIYSLLMFFFDDSERFISASFFKNIDPRSKRIAYRVRRLTLSGCWFTGRFHSNDSPTNYFLHDSPLAQKKIKRYLKDHRSSFQTLKKKYAVSPETVAALLWVETKHGKTLGSFPMPFVYYSMIIGSHPVYIRSMVALAPEKIAKGNPKNLTLSAVQEKVITRCKSKADWAINELKAAYQIQQEHDFNPFHQKASFAGAFGISQFIPSTYLKLAVSEFRTKPDLYKHSDAILSVGNFLKSYGWKNSDPDAEAKALYAYNHSKDYGAVILKLAEEASH